MTSTLEYQTALFDILAAIEECPTAVVITHYDDGDSRMLGATWEVDNPAAGIPPTFTLSDNLYDLYCKHVGMENTLQRLKA